MPEQQRHLLPRVVIAASLGALFEWYDFYLYGSLATVLAKQFFSGLEPSSAFILTLLAFAAGFVVRPFGALVFGRLGDRAGRKYTFLITLMMMGVATFLVGLLPNYATAGVYAPIALVVLRMVQGLALGGEYGGAATYVAEHVPPERRAAATSWIQMTGSFGLMLSLSVILLCRYQLGEAFDVWGWRIPFLFSALLLCVSVYVRLQLQESPVFLAMKAAGKTSQAPLSEAFGHWRYVRVVLCALFGLAVGQAMVTYTGEIYVLYFLTVSLKVDASTVNELLVAALAIGTPLTWVAGYLADRIGRKTVILVGCFLAAVTFMPIFKALTHYANPALESAILHAPVVVWADPHRCSMQFDPIGKARFTTSCDVVKSALARGGIPYTNIDLPAGQSARIRVGERDLSVFEGSALRVVDFDRRNAAFRSDLTHLLGEAGYPLRAVPQDVNHWALLGLLTLLMSYVAIVYGPLAAWLVELFPARIRYSAMSLPYHLGFGWFGGFLPAIAFMLVAQSGDIYGGLWYPIVAALGSVAIGLLWLPETLPRHGLAAAPIAE